MKSSRKTKAARGQAQDQEGARRVRIVTTLGGLGLLGLLFACRELPARQDLALTRPPDPAGPRIRVVVARGREHVQLVIGGAYEFVGADGSPLVWGGQLSQSTVRARGGMIVINGRSSGQRTVTISTRRAHDLTLNGGRYTGQLKLIADGDRVHAVNVLPLEEYLGGVLLGEMPVNRWHDEALQAQAVASRSYALFQMARRRHRAWDVTATQSSQVFKNGRHHNPKVNRIINATRGLVLHFEGKVIPAYFHSSCGGHTEANGRVFNERTIGPLRGSPCGWCQGPDNKHARWSRSFRKSELTAALQKRFRSQKRPRIERVRALEITGRGVSGRALSIRVRHAFAPFDARAEHLRQALGPMRLKSTNFAISATNGSITFTGRGFGHGVGLCQYGAEGQARAGYTYREILQRYYPGAALRKMY